MAARELLGTTVKTRSTNSGEEDHCHEPRCKGYLDEFPTQVAIFLDEARARHWISERGEVP
jgi:hypothetical protein